MDRTVKQWRFKEGDQVMSADEHKLGKVVGFVPDMLEPTQLVVERGLLFKHDYHVPVSAVTNYDAETIYIALTKDAVLNANSGYVPPSPDASSTDQQW